MRRGEGNVTVLPNRMPLGFPRRDIRRVHSDGNAGIAAVARIPVKKISRTPPAERKSIAVFRPFATIDDDIFDIVRVRLPIWTGRLFVCPFRHRAERLSFFMHCGEQYIAFDSARPKSDNQKREENMPAESRKPEIEKAFFDYMRLWFNERDVEKKLARE
jgi:hypothetical protein